MTSIYLHIVVAGFMFTNREVFETKQRADGVVAINLKGELEKEIIQPNEDDAGY